MFNQKKLRCGIHIGDSFYWGATRIIWPFAWIEPKENYILEIKKIHSVFFKTYQIIHNDKSISKFLLISTREQFLWNIIIKKLQCNYNIR